MSPYPELLHKWSHTYSILSIIPFPSKRLLFAATQDSLILIFDLAKYQLVQTIALTDPADGVDKDTRSSVLCLARSQDERYLLSAGTDSLVRVWELRQAQDLWSLENIATVYSITDIGDIFSLQYLDTIDTLVFGCQNASMLFVDNLLRRIYGKDSSEEPNFDRLPHRRYDKFFDSIGPSTHHKSKTTHSTSMNSRIGSPEPKAPNILEVPPQNIIKYAHNGFVYSICKIPLEFDMTSGSTNERVNEERIVSASGDGVNKIWTLARGLDGVVNATLSYDEMDNGDSVFTQAIEFPFLYSGGSDGVLKIWDLSTNQLCSTLHCPDRSDILSVTVHCDHIFTTSQTGITIFHQDKIVTWNPNQGKVLSSSIFERLASDGTKSISLITGGNNGQLNLWDCSTMVQKEHNGFELLQPLALSSATVVSSTNNSNKRHKPEIKSNFNPASLDFEDMLTTLRELISFPTISQFTSTSIRLASRKCATQLQKLFCKLGASKCRILPIKDGSNPTVLAHFEGNADNSIKKKVMWYGHYDVTPPGDLNRWLTDPFNLTSENGYLKGRGVTDNKGPLVSAIYSVATCLLDNNLKNDVIFLIEGNEEIGSPGLEEVCLKYKDIIADKIDWILLSNSTWVDKVHPCLNYGLRGVINARIKISTGGTDKHSGIDGGVAREPAVDLFQVISTLTDSSGKIKIKDFYASLTEVSVDEMERFEKVIKTAQFDRKRSVEELITNWATPSLSITSLKTTAPENITVIPSEVSVGLSIRLVPEQNLKLIVSNLLKHIQTSFENLNSPNRLDIEVLNQAEAWLSDPTNDAYQILRKHVARTWNMEPLFVREGGSIPSLRTLENIFNAQAVQIPCGQSTDNAHLDNENLRIKNWFNLVEIVGNVVNEL